MFTEIRCEICINHFVEIMFTLSCVVVDINLLQTSVDTECAVQKASVDVNISYY